MTESVEASLFEQLWIDAPAELMFLGHCFLIDNSLIAVSGTQSRTNSVKERPCESGSVLHSTKGGIIKESFCDGEMLMHLVR